MSWGGCQLKELTHSPKAILLASSLDPSSLQLKCVMHPSLWSVTHVHGGGKRMQGKKNVTNTKTRGIQGSTREKTQQQLLEAELTCVFFAFQMTK